MSLEKSGKAQGSDDPSQENCLFNNHRMYLRTMGRGFCELFLCMGAFPSDGGNAFFYWLRAAVIYQDEFLMHSFEFIYI